MASTIFVFRRMFQVEERCVPGALGWGKPIPEFTLPGREPHLP